jgi:hypothetical protein
MFFSKKNILTLVEEKKKKYDSKKINIQTLVLSGKKILDKKKKHNPPLQVKWSVPNNKKTSFSGMSLIYKP